jgi:hypothetical protein
MSLDDESDVGIGVVYEQFMLNRLLRKIIRKHHIASVLEAPVYGMAGLCGINSMALAEDDIQVAIADNDGPRLERARDAWASCGRKAEFVLVDDFGKLPFPDSQFGLAYNFAALWHLPGNEPERTIKEMVRVSGKLVLICMPNPWNPMFQLRSVVGRLPKNRKWASMKRIKGALVGLGMKVVDEGLLDIPPWPDTVIPIKDILGKLGIRKGGSWRWSMMDYYSGKNPEVKAKAEKYSFIEDGIAPRPFKMLMAHHRYAVFQKC